MNPLKPEILKEDAYSKKDLEKLKKKAVIIKYIYALQLDELFEIENPELLFSQNFKEKQKNYVTSRLGKMPLCGDWIFFPWNKFLVHNVAESEYKKILTARNKDIINSDEQDLLANYTIAIAGLSVGSGIVQSLVHMGMCNTLKLSDFDTLSTSNLNRVRTGLPHVGDKKLDILSQEIYEINPYQKIISFEKGLNKKNLKDFVGGKIKTDLIFEIIDDFKMKIQLRIEARAKKVPLIMLTNLGDSILIDVERYDLHKNLPIFNGRIGNTENRIMSQNISKKDEKKIAIDIVGMKNIPPRVLKSVQEIGKTLIGRPQLASTVITSSGLGAYFARKIALGESVPSGRSLIKFDDFLKY